MTTEIRGYEGRYEINSDGWVRNVRTGRVLKSCKNLLGYKFVNLYKKNCKKAPVYIHRLVANSFLPNPYNFPQVNHLDADKCNNASQNLEWCTAKANMKHAAIKGLLNKKLKGQHVIQIRKLYKTGLKQADIANQFHIDQSMVSTIVNHKKRQHIL